MQNRIAESLGQARQAAQPLREIIGAVIGAAVGAVLPAILGGSTAWVVAGAVIGVVVGAVVAPVWVAVRTFTSHTRRRVDVLEAQVKGLTSGSDLVANESLAKELTDLAAGIANFHAKGRQQIEERAGSYRTEGDVEYHARFNLAFDSRLRSLYAQLKRAGITTDADLPFFHDAFHQTDVQIKFRELSDEIRESDG
jgi:hypothetical protein